MTNRYAHDLLHIVKYYDTGVGHIERGYWDYLVSFYGRRVETTRTQTLEDARRALRRFANRTKEN